MNNLFIRKSMWSDQEIEEERELFRVHGPNIAIVQGNLCSAIEREAIAFLTIRDPAGEYLMKRSYQKQVTPIRYAGAVLQKSTGLSSLYIPKLILEVKFRHFYNPAQDPTFIVETKDEFLLPQLKLSEILERADATEDAVRTKVIELKNRGWRFDLQTSYGGDDD